MLEFEIDLSAIRAIGETAKRLQDFRAPLAESGAWLERSTKDRFDKEEDPEGKPWAPLAKSTLQKKKTRAILRESGILAASITTRGLRPNEVRVGTSIFYGIYHQEGVKPFQMKGRSTTLRFKVGKNGRSKFAKKEKANFEQDVTVGPFEHPGIPARPFLGINEKDVGVIRGIFADYIEGR